MDPATGYGIMAGAQIIGGYMNQQGMAASNASNKAANWDSLTMSRLMANEQMGFQERMSNTAHQRQTADLKAAGLNPILGINAGASSPAGAMGQTSTPNIQNENEGAQDAISGAVSTALHGKRLAQDLKNLKAQEKATLAQEKNLDASAKKANMETDIMSKNLPGAQIKESIMRDVQKFIQHVKPSAEAQKKIYEKPLKNWLKPKPKYIKNKGPM